MRPETVVCERRPCARRVRARATKPSSARLALGATLMALAAAASAVAHAPERTGMRSLADLSLEELMQVEVTLVSRVPERRFDAPAAVFVLTHEDIRRSGASSLPEVLRLVPGVHVARMDSKTWAISARGFNGQFSRKLLVLIDGRSVYTPVFSGVFWDVQDVPLEDIERIEVVRGPGGTLWGANAVNGIVNIVTRSAWQTEGGLISMNGGARERGVGTVRYGGRTGDRMAYRVFGRVGDDDGFADAGVDAWHLEQGGFRIDWQFENDALVLIGGGHDGLTGEQRRETPPGQAPLLRHYHTDLDGGHVLLRWDRVLAGGSNVQLQFYADRDRRRDETESGEIFSMGVDTLDADVQMHIPAQGRHHLTVGGGYRIVDDRLAGSFGTFLPEERTHALLSGFVEDRIALVPDRLGLVLEARLEHNDFTGLELQPALRLFYTPRQRETVWLAVARAVRTPSRADSDIVWRLSAPPGSSLPGELRLFGSPDIASEVLTSFELGYRVQPLSSVVVDLALFHNEYDELVNGVPRSPFFETTSAGGSLVIPLELVNGPGGTTDGAEVELRFKPTSRWELDLAYTAVLEDFITTDTAESPGQQVAIRSLLDLSRSVELDLAAFWVDRLPNLAVDDYLRLDVRLGWRLREGIEASIGARNLGGRHYEFAGGLSGFVPVEIEPQLYGRVTLQW